MENKYTVWNNHIQSFLQASRSSSTNALFKNEVSDEKRFNPHAHEQLKRLRTMGEEGWDVCIYLIDDHVNSIKINNNTISSTGDIKTATACAVFLSQTINSICQNSTCVDDNNLNKAHTYSKKAGEDIPTKHLANKSKILNATFFDCSSNQ